MIAVNDRLPYLRDKTSKLSTRPGCYIMKDKGGKIIYIGKAKNLKNRVTSYFRENADHLPKVAKMVSNVYDYDFIITDSEFESLVLECSLIKQNKPKYNIMLKDDKGYSYIKITNEAYPRIQSVLQKENDNATYIGPYTSSYSIKQAVIEANKFFSLPTCNKKFPQEFNKSRPCLNYHIRQCMGVCTGRISQNEYNDIVRQAISYIQNGSDETVRQLKEEMNKASDNLEFEVAAKLRDRISAIEKASESSQKVVDTTINDCDIIAASQNNGMACISILMYRGGRLFDKDDFYLGEQDDTSSLREGFITQFYSSRSEIPKEIYVDSVLEDADNITAFLRELCGHAVNIYTPQRSTMLRLVMLAKSNASEYLSIKVGRSGKEIVALEELAKALRLPEPPKIIECYDISNLASTDMVAGMVVFENGRPNKKLYRKFSIKTVFEQNDYACMCEVLTRRFTHQLEGDDSFSTVPDLIFLDGGKGHVNAVEPVLREMGITTPVYGLVKDSKHRTRAIATGGGEISMSTHGAAFMLMTQIQDEVHRYALAFQKAKRKASAYQLELTTVKGIGQAKAKKLLTYYKTKEALKNASAEELARIAGVGMNTATELKKVTENI